MNKTCFDWENFPNNRGYSEYNLDFSSQPPRTYKQCDFVTLYNGGPLEIYGNPYRDPEQLVRVHRELGLDFRLWSNMANLQLFTPDWRPIRKGGTDMDCVLLDHNHNLVVAPSWAEKVIYYSPHAWPSGGRKITARIPNRERAKTLKRALSETLKLAHTYYVMDGDTTGHRTAARYVDDLLHGGAVELKAPEDGFALWELGKFVANREINTQIARWTEDKVESTWLRFKTK